MTASDESLLAGMAAGDPEAAAAFVRRFQARVYGLALMITSEPATAEEVAQEAFLRAWRHAEAYDVRRGRVATWLLTIARNAAVDVVRVRREQAVDPTALLALVSTPEEGDADVDRLVNAEGLRAALRELPREQAVAVVLAAFYGMTAREISERESVPLGTAKTRIRTGLIRLRDRLEVSDD